MTAATHYKTKSHKEYKSSSEDGVPLAKLKKDVYMGCINSIIDSGKESDVKESDVKRDSNSKIQVMMTFRFQMYLKT